MWLSISVSLRVGCGLITSYGSPTAPFHLHNNYRSTDQVGCVFANNIGAQYLTRIIITNDFHESLGLSQGKRHPAGSEGKPANFEFTTGGQGLRLGPSVVISGAAIPRDLIESELFGYFRGAFTGARRNGMIGKFELANNGTLYRKIKKKVSPNQLLTSDVNRREPNAAFFSKLTKQWRLDSDHVQEHMFTYRDICQHECKICR